MASTTRSAAFARPRTTPDDAAWKRPYRAEIPITRERVAPTPGSPDIGAPSRAAATHCGETLLSAMPVMSLYVYAPTRPLKVWKAPGLAMSTRYACAPIDTPQT